MCSGIAATADGMSGHRDAVGRAEGLPVLRDPEHVLVVLTIQYPPCSSDFATGHRDRMTSSVSLRCCATSGAR